MISIQTSGRPFQFAFLFVLSLFSNATTLAGERPNIILIMADDLGYKDVGFHGSKEIRTPNLDRLARDGVVFTSAYVAHPFCGPSRVALMTGRYPHALGAQFNLPESGAGPDEGIPVNELLISSLLRQSGYRTGLVGKWHLGEAPKFQPNNRGFDDFFGFLGGGHCYLPDQYRQRYEASVRAGRPAWSYLRPLEHNGKQVDVSEYLTDALSAQAARFVWEASKNESPFFLFLSYNAPHTPLEAKSEDLERFESISDVKRKTYAAMVYAMDRGIGKVVNAVKESGEDQNTLTIFLSDNGGRLDAGASNHPLQGEKNTCWEGGVRVPMLFHFPARLKAGRIIDFPVTSLDLYPTIARLSENEIPVQKELDGIDLWRAVVTGTNPIPNRTIYTMRYDLNQGFSEIGARRGNQKVFHNGTRDWQLFHLDRDIGETTDLSSQQPERVRKMSHSVAKWRDGHLSPKWFHDAQAAKRWHSTGLSKQGFSAGPGPELGKGLSESTAAAINRASKMPSLQ